MKNLLLILLIPILVVFFTSPSFASHTASHKVKSKSPALSASMAKNRLSVSASFSNLKNVKSVSYQLTYDSNKGPQGVGGTFKVKSSNTVSRKLLLGTCSKNVCTYHRDVKNAVLSADFTLKTGGIVSFEKKL